MTSPNEGARRAKSPGAAGVDVGIRVFDSLADARSVWQQIEATGDSYVFQSYAWLSAWHETLGAAQGILPCVVAVLRPDDTPIMLLPLGLEKRRGVTRLIWMGGALSDYQAPLLCPSFAAYVSSAAFGGLWQAIRAAVPPHDVVFFEKQPECMETQPNPLVSLGGRPHASNAHLVHLDGDFADFLTRTRSAKSLSTERRKRRKLERRGALSFVVADGGAGTESILQTTLNQKSQNYRELGVTDLFADNNYCRFLQQLTQRHCGDGFVQLAALLLDDRIIATHWGLLYRKRLYYMLPTYERDDLTSLSPGNALLHHLLSWCFDNDVRVCDFTVGDEPYKYQWRDTQLDLVDFLQPVTLRGHIHVQPQRVARRLKRFIKKSPRLLRGAHALRSMVARLARRRPSE